jgi:hypothetical protein
MCLSSILSNPRPKGSCKPGPGRERAKKWKPLLQRNRFYREIDNFNRPWTSTMMKHIILGCPRPGRERVRSTYLHGFEAPLLNTEGERYKESRRGVRISEMTSMRWWREMETGDETDSELSVYYDAQSIVCKLRTKVEGSGDLRGWLREDAGGLEWEIIRDIRGRDVMVDEVRGVYVQSIMWRWRMIGKEVQGFEGLAQVPGEVGFVSAVGWLIDWLKVCGVRHPGSQVVPFSQGTGCQGIVYSMIMNW